MLQSQQINVLGSHLRIEFVIEVECWISVGRLCHDWHECDVNVGVWKVSLQWVRSILADFDLGEVLYIITHR